MELNERAPKPTRLRVLIIDDEPEIAEVAAEFLELAGMAGGSEHPIPAAEFPVVDAARRGSSLTVIRGAARAAPCTAAQGVGAAAKPSAALIGSCEKVARQVPASMLVRWSL